MEKYLDDLRAHLMETDEEFRRLAGEHEQYKKKVDEFESRTYLSEEEKIEETRLKKLKLRLKDKMLEILSRHRAQHAV